GKSDDGTLAGEGEYTVAFEAKGFNGAKLQVNTQFEGIISGVNFTPKGPVFQVGNQTVRLADVKRVFDPRALNAKQPQPSNPTQAAPQAAVPKQAANQASPTPSNTNL